MLNGSKYANCGATFFVLVLTTAMFVGISLLPLMGVWYTVVAIITGFCAATVFLLLPSVNKAQQRSNSSGWVILQILCALLIIGAATARYARGRVKRRCTDMQAPPLNLPYQSPLAVHLLPAV